jgi:diaminohydroxyphosphoribosylaminopyrimidine deaminase/5-amino-6-(5-phosphoribosylamino)uracil reductase
MAERASQLDEQFIRRAIRLAMNGRGRVEPNPMVGCVIVNRDGRIIGEGYHAQFGGPHAEPAALANCTESPAGATAYVTLEPCCHTNKQTPPCTPRLIEAKIARVVIGCLDPNPDVNGKGVAMLRAAGVQVDGSKLENEAKQLIAPFLASTVHGRPYVTLKWAESADRLVAGPGGERRQISNAKSTALVHKLRARSDAILIGIRTALTDNPVLTARGVEFARPLLRVVLDRDLRLPLDSQLVKFNDAQNPVLVFCDDEGYQENPTRVEKLQGAGVSIVALGIDASGNIRVNEIVRELHRRSIAHLLVEGGPTVHQHFFRSGVVDRVWRFRSPKCMENGVESPSAATVPPTYFRTGEMPIGDDTLNEYLNPDSAAFFSRASSAEFILERWPPGVKFISSRP